MWLSHVGTAGLVWLALGLALAALWRRPWLFATVGVADAIAQLTARGLKSVVGVERPPLRFVDPPPLVHLPGDPSFPSGHAASSFACALVLSSAAPRLGAPLFLLAAGIAFSRVYVGVHWPLDVLGGTLLGLAVGFVLGRSRFGEAARREGRPAADGEG